MNDDVVISKEGDTVDLIAFERFGAHGMESIILEANPGLAKLGDVLPIGTPVIIPAPEVKPRASIDRLWS